MAPSVANSSVTGLVVSRDSFSFSCSAPNRSDGWAGWAARPRAWTQGEPATLYTYTAHYIGQEGLTSERAHFNVTTPPEAPLPIVTIPLSPSSCGPCIALTSEPLLSPIQRHRLAEGRAYNYTALLTVDNGGCASRRGVGEEGALDRPACAVPVIHANTNYPSVTVNVSLPLGLESVVVRTFVVSSENGATGYKVDWATAYVWKCGSRAKGAREARWATCGDAAAKAVVTMTMVDSNTIKVHIEIEHDASNVLADNYQLTCNDTTRRARDPYDDCVNATAVWLEVALPSSTPW
eukprot:tig00000431_g693.t1